MIVNGVPVLTGTFPSVDPVSQALGGLPLKPEKSVNYSLGTVLRLGGFDLTVDGYYIRLKDQLGLSENISASFSPQVAALLDPPRLCFSHDALERERQPIVDLRRVVAGSGHGDL